LFLLHNTINKVYNVSNTFTDIGRDVLETGCL
jgi:hypothetical protein